jgi:hypothetical protein
MKKVFSSNSQLAHAWANQLQYEGRANSMFFYGPVIYSWGQHYEIARYVDAPNGQKVCFINSNGYSNSTAKHTRHVSNAIPDGIPTFYVPFAVDRSFYSYTNYHTFSVDKLGGIIDILLVECSNKIFDQLKARTKYYSFNEAAGIYTKIEQICELFGLPVPARPEKWTEAETKANFLRDTVVERQTAKQQKELEKQRELLEKWLRHEFNGQLYNIPVHLRVSRDGRLIETTKGASVGVEAAFRLLDRLRANEDVKGEKIDGFTVIENTDQAVKIGCHVITWPVINQLFK